jgi:heme iron utilization protein
LCYRFAPGKGFRLEAIVNEPSASRAAELVRCCKVAALGTLHHGAPSVSMVPYAIIEDPLAFVLLVSALSAHTKEMLGDPNVALMIMEPETDTKLPHTLARVSIQGRAEPIAQGDPRFGAARAAYSARFPDMVGLFELGDFTLFAIAAAAVRVIAGFAQAASITPASFARSVRHTGQ